MLSPADSPNHRFPQSHIRLLTTLAALTFVGLLLIGCTGEALQPAAAATAPTDTPTLTPRSTYTPTPMPAERTVVHITVPETPLIESVTPEVTKTNSKTTTPAPKRPVAPTPGPTVAPDLALEFTKIRPNQFLSTVANRYGVTIDDIAKFSGIENPDVVAIGQGLIIPHKTNRYTPDKILLPDSELVYGPAYVDFDIAEFVESQGGYLAGYSISNGREEVWTGADIIERTALRYSVGPRVLLALLEARSGWVTDPEPGPAAIERPFGYRGGPTGLQYQSEWTSNQLNRGFYGWQDRGETAIRFHDGVVARGAPNLNPGTFAVQYFLAQDSNWADIETELDAFAEAYERLFGDPEQYDAGPVLPAGLEQPELQLPWKAGEQWYLTGGPHGGWGSGSGWAALDFVSENTPLASCIPAEDWAVAAAPGIVARNDNGELLIDLDKDGDVRTGWVLQYLHITDRVPQGRIVRAGTPVGRPACDGGTAETSHLHISRRYNGVWVAADGPVPFVLGDWRARGDFEYSGSMVNIKDGAVREACECRDPEMNGLKW